MSADTPMILAQQALKDRDALGFFQACAQLGVGFEYAGHDLDLRRGLAVFLAHQQDPGALTRDFLADLVWIWGVYCEAKPQEDEDELDTTPLGEVAATAHDSHLFWTMVRAAWNKSPDLAHDFWRAARNFDQSGGQNLDGSADPQYSHFLIKMGSLSFSSVARNFELLWSCLGEIGQNRVMDGFDRYLFSGGGRADGPKKIMEAVELIRCIDAQGVDETTRLNFLVLMMGQVRLSEIHGYDHEDGPAVHKALMQGINHLWAQLPHTVNDLMDLFALPGPKREEEGVSVGTGSLYFIEEFFCHRDDDLFFDLSLGAYHLLACAPPDKLVVDPKNKLCLDFYIEEVEEKSMRKREERDREMFALTKAMVERLTLQDEIKDDMGRAASSRRVM